jgi:DHA1 family bicyclomycin/chloramphenicol resistance-like MFS transporter
LTDKLAETRPTLGLVLVLGALTAFTPFSIDLYLPGLPSMATELRASAAQAEMTVAAFFIGISAGQLFYGPLSDRVGRRIPLLAGIFVYTAASVACALAPTIGDLIGFRLVQALGGCAGVVLARAIVRDRFPPQQTAQVFSTLMLVMGLAPVLAPLAGSYLLTVSTWRTTFWLLTLFGATCGVAALFALPESRPEHVAVHARTESPLAAYVALLRQPRLIGYVLYGACSSAALLTYVTTSPEIMIGIYHVPVRDFGWVFGINSAGLIAASQINARLLRYHAYEAILPWANLGAILSGVLLVAQALTGFGGLVGLMVPLFLVMASFGFNAANAMAGAMSVDPRRGGSTAGLMGAAQFAAGAGAAGLAGAFHDGTARPTAWVVLASVLIAGVALHGLARRPDPAV